MVSIHVLLESYYQCTLILVKRDHTTSNQHIHWDLSRHSSEYNHFFSRFRMIC